MRDIRKDLRERFDAVIDERQKIQARLADLQAVENGLKMLMRNEDEHFSTLTSPLFPAGMTGTGLAQLIVTAMEVKNRPLDLAEIKQELLQTDYNFGEKNPGRAIHFALVGLRESEIVERLEDKRWKLKNKASQIAAD